MACSGLKLLHITTKKTFAFNFCVARPSILCTRYFSIKDDEGKDSEGKNNIKSPKEDQSEVSKISSKVKKSTSENRVEPEEAKEAAKKKLLSLLSEIKVSSDFPSPRTSNLNLAQPLKRPQKKERFADLLQEKSPPENKMKLAVKAVASTLGGEPERIETELNEKLSSINLTEGSDIPEEEEVEPKDVNQNVSLIDEELSKNLMSSVEEVASTVTTSPAPVQSELTRRLLRLSLDGETSPEKRKSVLSIFEGMKIESDRPEARKQSKVTKSRQESSWTKPVRKPQIQSRINLFESTPLNISGVEKEREMDTRNAIWQNLLEKELRMMAQFAPVNAFEEMILWTEQGKHWTFPIDNDIESGAEENVGFNEHVFLDHHLENGFPKTGPIRHFMELVVVGLSKNPYISAERKVENINWFRNYFQEKEEVLRECGAIA